MQASKHRGDVRSITVCHLLLPETENANRADFTPETRESATQSVGQTERMHTTPLFHAIC